MLACFNTIFTYLHVEFIYTGCPLILEGNNVGYLTVDDVLRNLSDFTYYRKELQRILDAATGARNSLRPTQSEIGVPPSEVKQLENEYLQIVYEYTFVEVGEVDHPYIIHTLH